MAKQGMKRPEPDRDGRTPQVHEIEGKAKSGKEKANPIVAGTEAPALKVFHAPQKPEKPVAGVYSAIDNDLARDNLENDIPAADLQDL